MSTETPIHITPAKCQECGHTTIHAFSCSHLTVEQARYHAERFRSDALAEFRRTVTARKQAMFWEGKFHVVRHENNKLRKENVALKLLDYQAKQLTDWQELSAAFCALPLPEEHRRVKLWPNNWHQDCAAIAHFIHTHSGEEQPPKESSS